MLPGLDFDIGTSSISSSFLTAVDIFDGSAVDPVVVSNMFWAGLKGKIVAVLVGSLVATIAFAILMSFVASKLLQAGEFLSDQIKSSSSSSSSTSQSANKNTSKTFLKANNRNSEISSTPDFKKLFICLAIDAIGSSSEIIPILGKSTDFLFAPIAGTILRSLFGGSNILFLLEFTEEILPFTDVLPLATIW